MSPLLSALLTRSRVLGLSIKSSDEHYLLIAIYPHVMFQMSSLYTLRVTAGSRYLDRFGVEGMEGKPKVPSNEPGGGLTKMQQGKGRSIEYSLTSSQIFFNYSLGS